MYHAEHGVRLLGNPHKDGGFTMNVLKVDIKPVLEKLNIGVDCQMLWLLKL